MGLDSETPFVGTRDLEFGANSDGSVFVGAGVKIFSKFVGKFETLKWFL